METKEKLIKRYYKICDTLNSLAWKEYEQGWGTQRRANTSRKCDGLAIENEMQQLGKAVIVPTFSGEYLIRMAAKACTIPIGADAFENMSLSDYNKIRSAARSFLLNSEL